MILNNFFQDPLEQINAQNRKSSRQQKMYVKKSSLKRIQSAVSKKGSSAPQKDKSLNMLLGLKNESIAEKYFSMAQKQKGQKNSLLDNYNELDEMIHNYLYTNNQQQTSILTSKPTNTLQFQEQPKFSRTSSKNVLLSQNYMPGHELTNVKANVTGGPLPNTVSEKILKNWVQSSTNQNRSNQIYEGMSESQSNMGSSSNPSQAADDKSKRNKEIYSNLTSNIEYNFLNINTASTCNTKEDNINGRRIDENRINNFNTYQSGMGKSNGLNQDNSSNTLDNNTTNNTTSFRSSKLNSTPQNANQISVTGPSTPSYAMGTIVSNNKTNHARRFSRTRPVTAALSKNSNGIIYEQQSRNNIESQVTTSMKPWLRHELFTKKQKGELLDEYDESNRKYGNYGIESDEGENDHSKSRSQMQDFRQKSKHHHSNSKSDGEDYSQYDTEQIRNSEKPKRKENEMSHTAAAGFSGYNKLLRSESNKTDQNLCDNIIRDCENILNKIQKRDGQQLYNSQKKESQIFGQSSLLAKDSKNPLGGRGSSTRNSFRSSSSIPRPQSVKKLPSNNLFGGPGELIEESNQNGNEDDTMTLQKIANTLLKKKLALKENIHDIDESPLFSVKKDKNPKGSVTTTGVGQRFSTSSYPHRQYLKEKEDNSVKLNGVETHELSQIQELQEGEGILGEQPIKQTPNIYKKSNSLPRSQSSAKQTNNRFYDNNEKIAMTDTKERLTQEALKAAATIAKNVQKFSGNYSNNNQNAILQRPESKRHTTGAIINMNSTATGTVSTASLSSNLFMLNSLKRNSEVLDKGDKSGKENIKSLAQTMKITSANDQKKIEDQLNNSKSDDKRVPLGTNNKLSRPATAAISKSGSGFSEMSTNSNLTTNKLMERFEIKCCIGKGSYAVVKLAKDTNIDKNVAIKMYDKYKLIDPQKRNNVKREIAILNKLDHTNIIKLYQTIDTRSSVNLVMEYISSQSLRQFMKALDGRQLEEKIAKSIFKQLVSAVQYCHEWEVIHRDIKLENVMLDVNNSHQIKLIDFGFAIRIPADKKLNIFCGTPSYMSPEITKKKEYFGKPADVWSLGVVLYALLCGRFPFKGKDDNDLFRKIQSGDFKITGNFSQSANKLINKLLRQNPQERPTAKEILQDRWFME